MEEDLQWVLEYSSILRDRVFSIGISHVAVEIHWVNKSEDVSNQVHSFFSVSSLRNHLNGGVELVISTDPTVRTSIGVCVIKGFSPIQEGNSEIPELLELIMFLSTENTS
jgi:hypothetical protein